MLWHIELKFRIWLCLTVLQIKFECRQFASIFVGVMPLLELRILEIHSFPHFSLTCFDILSWNFAYDFVLLYYRSSLSVVNFYTPVFRDGTYYGMVMSVRVSVRPTLRPSVWVSVRPFSALFSYMLWHIELKFCTWLCFNVLQIKFECHHFASIFEGVMPLCELRIYEMQFSAVFSNMLWHIELKFCTWLCFNILQGKFECCPFASTLEGVIPLLEPEYRKYTVFRSFLLHALTYGAKILHITLF